MKKATLAVVALLAALVLLCTVTACSEAPSPTDTPASTSSVSSTFADVDVNQAFERLGADPKAQLVDVREPDEWASTGVISSAVLISLGDLEALAPSEVAKDRPVYVICASGNRSRPGAQTLLDLGYTEVFNVDGGMGAWLAAGLPVEDYQP